MVVSEETRLRLASEFKRGVSEKERLSVKDILKLKKEISRSLGLDHVVKNGEILSSLSTEDKERFIELLKMKPVRTASGVSVVELMTAPFACPHGTCIFCPGGPRFGTPQGYTGYEPGARRAKSSSYDPYVQMNSRLKHYTFMGYEPEKIELIINGGTFTALPEYYAENFVTQAYKAMNDFPDFNPSPSTLDREKERNEKAKARCVLFAIETKPERCGEQEINRMLRYGITRVELGVQSVFNEVLLRNNRGHTIEDVKDASKRLRDAAFKLDYHVMINLPFSDIDKDKETIRSIYEDEDFKPDAIKLYPTLVIEGTGLYRMWMDGKYTPYSIDEVKELIKYAESKAPRWLRIMRVERDIPSDLVEAGMKSTNIRQIVQRELKMEGIKLNDIRSREVGHVNIDKPMEITMNRINYRASGGDEIFLSFDDRANDALIAFLRLRIPDGAKEALVRELHVYGPQVPLTKEVEGFQSKGFGRRLLSEAEGIAKSEYSAKKIRIICGVGVREYYRRLGYTLEDNYMVKMI
ncbi:MAG: tRNA uridine(34) 5-carboxymethylaminomethyl modification radical SAM/GNAT enzyme Elp3 [Candidatus Parvarchaeota archaeon]|nr:tRNA uridine(34) 5-carboxymethylaminomethyl modification radical SAM/GNAT enzyme Elp3 [Candidatus Parvarchaeota archaeon]